MMNKMLKTHKQREVSTVYVLGVLDKSRKRGRSISHLFACQTDKRKNGGVLVVKIIWKVVEVSWFVMWFQNSNTCIRVSHRVDQQATEDENITLCDCIHTEKSKQHHAHRTLFIQHEHEIRISNTVVNLNDCKHTR